MWRFIFFLIVLIASVWLGLEIAKDPGLAFFSYKDWSVEMPLWFAALSFIFLLLTLYMLLRVCDGVGDLFYRFKNWLQWRKKRKAYSRTHRGLLALIEGQWKIAERDLADGLAQSDAPLINYLGLAKAANEQSAIEKRDNYLRKAHAIAPQAEVSIGLTQAQLQIRQGQWEQALATLKHLKMLAPKHPLLLKLLERAYVHLADWQGLLSLLPSLYKYGIIQYDELRLFEVNTYQAYLQSFGQQNHTITELREFWNRIPRKFHKEGALLNEYIKQLIQYPDTEIETEALAYKVLKKSWNKDLAKQYGKIKTDDPKKQLAHAEKLLNQHPNQPALLLTLGRLSVRCQLWGKARRYYEESLNLSACSETFLEYGKLLEQLGDSRAAMESYRDGLIITLPPSQ